MLQYKRYNTGFALTLTVISFFALMIFGLLAGVAQADETGVSYTNAGSITVVTQTSSGQYADYSGYNPSLSADGRFIAFISQGNDLVPGVAHPSIFVHDTQTKQFEVVSKNSAGSRADANSSNPTISADGRYVVFSSLGSNLVSGDNNNVADVFIHDRQTHQTERVSVSSAGVEGNQQSSQGVVIGQALDVSSDGRYVSYSSDATNLVEGDTNNTTDVFVRDRQTGQTERVSITSSGVQANGGSLFASMSADGRFVSFVSYATNLVSGDTNNKADVFVHDRQTHQTERVSVSSSGTQVTGEVNAPMLSGDGRYVVFESSDGSLEAGDTNGNLDVFIHDRQTHTTSRIKSVTTSVGGIAPQISDNGAYVVFFSLFPTSSDKRTGDISLYNVQTAALTENLVASITGFNPRSTYYDNVAVSNEGRYIVFAYELKPIIPSAPAHRSQVFLIDREGTQPPTPTFTPTPGTPTPITPTPVAGDSGFKLNEHEWSFENAGYDYGWKNFRDTYGDYIEWNVNGHVTIHPGALLFYFNLFPPHNPTRGGVCYGMVTTAALRYRDQIPMPEGVETNNLFNVVKPPVDASEGTWLSSPVADYIVKYQGYLAGQEQNSDRDFAVTRSVEDSLTLIKQSIDTGLVEPYGLGLKGADASHNNKCIEHMLLPYAYEVVGDVTNVSVYNPNHPGKKEVVTFNTTTWTWQYASEPVWGEWGSGKTCKMLPWFQEEQLLYVLQLSFATHRPIPQWHVNSGSVLAAESNNSRGRTLFLSDNISFTVSGGKHTSVIPYGAIPGQEFFYPQQYLLDSNTQLSLTVDTMATGESVLTLFDPHTIISLGGQGKQGEQETVLFSENARRFSIHAVETEQRRITTITGNENQQYQVDLNAFSLESNSQANFTVGESGKITVTVGTDQAGYQGHFLQAGVSGTSEFTLTMPSLAAGDTHLLQPNWMNNSVLVQTDQDSNGTVDHQETIQSQTTQRVYLPLVKR